MGEAILSAACEVVAVLRVFLCVSVSGCDVVLSCVAVSFIYERPVRLSEGGYRWSFISVVPVCFKLI